MTYVDPLIESLPRLWKGSREELAEVARWLATEAPDRAAVKLAIALLGVSGEEQDQRVLHTLGLHDEFTLYSAVALTNLLESPADALFRLSRRVDGWGRIQGVERLAEVVEEGDAEIRDWLVREGFKNSVMYEYLAYTCAVAGDLEEALDREEVDDVLLESAGSILGALISGGPAEGIGDYEAAPNVVERYLYHLAPRASNLDQFLVAHSLREFLQGAAEPMWPPEKRSLLIAKCDSILDRPAWEKLVREHSKTNNDQLFWTVNTAAKHLGVDLWETHLHRLKQSPLDSTRWYLAMELSNEERIDGLIELAVQSLPLESIATGPRDEIGFGEVWEPHQCLDYVLQGLERYPRRGWILIRAGLHSPLTRHRNMALNALSVWEKSSWPEESANLLKQALQAEPNDDTRKRMGAILENER